MRQFYPLILLLISNVFMTYAWYGHLKFKATPLWIVIVASWGIAFLNIVFRSQQTELGMTIFRLPN